MSKKTILIYTSSGGNGHISVTNALKELLNTTYHVVTCDIFNEITHVIEPFYQQNNTHRSLTHYYNQLMTKGYNRVLSCIYYLGYIYFKLLNNRVKTLIKKHVMETNPDLIISVIPVINGQIAAVAHELNKPFLIIPTDIDIKTFTDGIHHHYNTHIHFGLYFHNNDGINHLRKKLTLAPSQITVIGPVLRLPFIANRRIKPITFRSNPRIMIMMGSLGVSNLIHIIATLLTIQHQMTLVVCVGRNEQLKERIKKLSCPTHITIELIGFTENIAPIMEQCSLFITKTGTTSIAEGIALGIPLILDATMNAVKWERYNRIFISKHKCGATAYTYKQLKKITEQFLTNQPYYESIAHNIHGYQIKNWHKTTLPLIDRLTKKSEQ